MITSAQSKKAPAGAGRIAGRYELAESLGEGGMGVVWRAQDTKTGAQVAIKIMKDVSDPAAVEMFAREWRALAELCHPNIVDVRDVDVLEENRQRKPFFVMPLLRGFTLAELIADKSSRLTVTRVVDIMTQVCRGLQAAHERHLVHRDLKPSNIFVLSDDTAKIIDFGVVHLAGSQSITGQKGTFQYMSPEQVQMKEITPVSDIFSLGVILYEALSGRKPFAYPTVEETVRAVLRQTPPPVSEINPSIPQAVGRVVHKCLAKSPLHRYSSARDLAEALGKALRNEAVYDMGKLQQRVERIRAAFRTGDEVFASEMLSEVESEGYVDPDITVLRMQIDAGMKQKKIRQLLESARARIEQDEIALGLDKLRELLDLDPENPDALLLRQQTENRRSEAQIGTWMDLANTHLANRDFAAARQAVREVIRMRSGDARAMDLMQQIERTEAEARRVREQKEQLYSTAMRSYQAGEIEAALTKLARLFSVIRSKPEAAVPERDAVYESFYKEVRSEHDKLRTLLEQAQHEFSEKNFAKALALCNDHLARFPADGVFQALKVQLEDAERQEISAYLATVTSTVEAEPDLDRRVDILREASERYPGEAQFAQQLKVVRERRDLVNAIVARARQLDERGSYAEALSQWDILRNIHPRYPGLAFELEQCRKKRDRTAAEEERSRLVEDIVGLMDARLYAKALERLRMALTDFPGDTELVGLEKLATVGQERTQEARRLFDEGQALISGKQWDRGIELLRSAMKLDPKDTAMREALIGVLTERSRELLDENVPEAERLYTEADGLDTSHRAVSALRDSIQEAKRQSYVGERLTAARGLMAAGDDKAALELVREARKQYPKDGRLQQFEANLLKQVDGRRLDSDRERNWEELAEARRKVELRPEPESIRDLLRLSQGLRSSYPGDQQTERLVADAEQVARRFSHGSELEDSMGPGSVGFGSDNGLHITEKRAEHSERATEDSTALREDDQTQLFAEPEAAANSAGKQQPNSRKVSRAKVRAASPTVPGTRPRRAVLAGIGVGALAAVLLLGLLVFRPGHGATKSPGPNGGGDSHIRTVSPSMLHLTVEPNGSTVAVNGTVLQGTDLAVPGAGSVDVEVSHPGYRTKSLQMDAKADPHIVLEPEPTHVWVQTQGAVIQLDGRRLTDAGDVLQVPADGKAHTLSVTDAAQQTSRITFQETPGAAPRVSSLQAKDLLVVASLGPAATLYGGDTLKSVLVGDRRVPVSATGTELPPLSENSATLRYGTGNDQGSLALEVTPLPTLLVRSLSAPTEMLVNSDVPSATLTMNGEPQKRDRHGWEITAKPGSYNFVLAAEGYEPQMWTTVLQPHQMLRKKVSLVKKVAAPTSASLLIADGTPNAEVDLDEKRLGELDARGGAQFARVLSAGKHVVTFRSASLCGVERRELDVNPPADVRLSDVKLTACGNVDVSYAGRAAVVRVRRKAADSGWSQLPLGKSSIAPGVYELTADSEGFPTFSTEFEVKPGSTAEVPLRFVRPQVCQLQDPTQATSDGDWFKPKNAGGLLYLRPGCNRVQIAFTKPRTAMFGKRHVQWEIVAADSAGRVQYVLDDQKITRKSFVGDVSGDEKEGKAGSAAGTQPVWFSVRINVEGAHVHIANERGETLDDFTPSAPALQNLSSGRLALKTNAPFTLKAVSE